MSAKTTIRDNSLESPVFEFIQDVWISLRHKNLDWENGLFFSIRIARGLSTLKTASICIQRKNSKNEFRPSHGQNGLTQRLLLKQVED